MCTAATAGEREERSVKGVPLETSTRVSDSSGAAGAAGAPSRRDGRRATSVPHTYRGYHLDPFQREAIAALEAGESVLVVAPTGTGKTLIADYLIEKLYAEGLRVVYTAPIKALSNQKFKEFKVLLGAERVGIVTGDVVINPDAPVRIMTTEIFRNILHQEPDRLHDTAYVIFDEIHYIDDPERGSVWEESLIFLLEHMRFLGLSATVPNVEELAAWVESVQGHPVRVIRHQERAVPLEHRLYEKKRGFTDLEDLRKYHARLKARGALMRRDDWDWPGPPRRDAYPHTTHLDLLEAMGEEYLPCLFFCFSRRGCESNASELAAHRDYLSPEEKRRVEEVVERTLEAYQVRYTGRLKSLSQLLSQGIGYHHAGMLPPLKEIVETLFAERLIRVLYCTETFAVGLNLPCRTVCFDSLTKWDGVSFRPLTNREYFQMAGRAGRRGIDERGFVFTVVDMYHFDPQRVPSLKESEVEPLQSQFTLSYNTILNLVARRTEEQIREILGANFAAFQTERRRAGLEREREQLQARWSDLYPEPKPLEGRAAGERGDRDPEGEPNPEGERGHRSGRGRKGAGPRLGAKASKALRRLSRRLRHVEAELAGLRGPDHFLAEYEAKRAVLERLDYLRGSELTSRGWIASHIHVQELLVTELICDGVLHSLDPNQLNGLAVAIDYEPRKFEQRQPHNLLDLRPVQRCLRRVAAVERAYLPTPPSVRFNDHLLPLAYRWSAGARFSDLMRGAWIDEGDLVFALRRAIDLLRQIRSAVKGDQWLEARISEAIERMDRDEVATVL